MSIKVDTLQRHFFSSGFFLLIALLALSCTKELSPNAPIPEPEKSIVRGVQRLEGYWKVVNGPSFVKSFIADTIISHFVTNEDEDYNFRNVDDRQVVFTDSTILPANGFSPLYFYRFSAQSDTLFFSYDSFYRSPYIAVNDSLPSVSRSWAPTIAFQNVSFFSFSSSSYVYGADRYGDYWYFRKDGYHSSIMEVRNLSGLTVKNDTFPGVTSIDVSGGYLWTAGPYFVDQRNLQDTTLIRRIDLTSQYSFQQGDQIEPLAIKDSLIVIIVGEDLLCFDISGRFIRKVPTYNGIFSMSFVGDQLVAGTNLSTINTVDMTTGRAIDSYMLPEGLYGDTIYPIVGIVDLGDHVGAFRHYPGGVNLYEFSFPK